MADLLSFATAAARAAATFSLNDIGRTVLQLDTLDLWKLQSIGPNVFVPVSPALRNATRSPAGDATLVNTDGTLLIDTSAARNVTMWSPSVFVGRIAVIIDKSGLAGTNNITLVRNGAEMIQGVAANRVLSADFGAWRVVSDGTNFFFG